MKKILIASPLVATLIGAAVYWHLDAPNREVKAAIRAQLSDPESAQFRNLRQGTSPIFRCGEVNARNRMGGFAGFARFSAMGLGLGDEWMVEVHPHEINPYQDRETAEKLRALSEDTYKRRCETPAK